MKGRARVPNKVSQAAMRMSCKRVCAALPQKRRSPPDGSGRDRLSASMPAGSIKKALPKPLAATKSVDRLGDHCILRPTSGSMAVMPASKKPPKKPASMIIG